MSESCRGLRAGARWSCRRGSFFFMVGTKEGGGSRCTGEGTAGGLVGDEGGMVKSTGAFLSGMVRVTVRSMASGVLTGLLVRDEADERVDFKDDERDGVTPDSVVLMSEK